MKKNCYVFMTVVLMSFFFAVVFAGCGGGGGGGEDENPPPVVKLSSIAITAPDKTIYAVGDSLDITGLAVTGTYSDGSKKTETIGVSNVSGFDSTTTGKKVLTVTVGGKTATFEITVSTRDFVLYEKWEQGENRGIFSAEILNGVLSKKTELIPSVVDEEEFYDAAYSPDKSKIAFVHQEDDTRDIAILDIATNEIFIILLGGYHDHPRWNSEGTKLIFVFKTDEASLGDIAMINLDGSELEFLTDSSDLDEGYPSFNPIDNNEIIYDARQGNKWGVSDIYTMEIYTGIITNLTNSMEFSEEDPRYSSDGLRIVYDSDESTDYWSAWIMNYDGTDNEFLSGDQYDIGWPIFSTDGERVYIMPKHPNPWVYVIPSDMSVFAEEVENSLGVFITDVK
jgi:hypothetical protein